jgi:hypothetical protein
MNGLLVDFGGVLTANVFTSFRAFCADEGIDPDRIKALFRSNAAALAAGAGAGAGRAVGGRVRRPARAGPARRYDRASFPGLFDGWSSQATWACTSSARIFLRENCERGARGMTAVLHRGAESTCRSSKSW